jgi:hypothetical protein
VSGGPALSAGGLGSLNIDGFGASLPFVVKGNDRGLLHLAFALDHATAAAFRGVPQRLARSRAA